MWLNKSYAKIFPGMKEHVYRNFILSLKWWAKKNPNATINFWFDGAYTDTSSLEAASQLLEAHDLGRVNLRNVQDLEGVQKVNISDRNYPVYFRADLYRLIATTHDLERGLTDYFVYADIDVMPMTEEQLFDEETMQNLDKFGMVVTRDGINNGMENSFHITSRAHENILEAIEFMGIQLNVERARCVEKYSWDPYRRFKYKDLAQVIYDSYPPMFQYLYHLEGYAKLEVADYSALPETSSGVQIIPRGYDPWVPYDKEKHGLSNFGICMGPFSSYQNWRIKVWNNEINEVFHYGEGENESFERIKVPTKTMLLPPSKGFGYS